jgi:hypothetical protein
MSGKHSDWFRMATGEDESQYFEKQQRLKRILKKSL